MSMFEDKNSKKYSTVEEYLQMLFYPILRKSINDLVLELNKQEHHAELEYEFNHSFFRNKSEIIKREKKLLKLERGSDYSEEDYEKINNDKDDELETTKIKDLNNKDFDPELDDSDQLDFDESEIIDEEAEPKYRFDPVKFLVERLRINNKSIKGNDINLFLNDHSENEIEDNNKSLDELSDKNN